MEPGTILLPFDCNAEIYRFSHGRGGDKMLTWEGVAEKDRVIKLNMNIICVPNIL